MRLSTDSPARSYGKCFRCKQPADIHFQEDPMMPTPPLMMLTIAHQKIEDDLRAAQARRLAAAARRRRVVGANEDSLPVRRARSVLRLVGITTAAMGLVLSLGGPSQAAKRAPDGAG